MNHKDTITPTECRKWLKQHGITQREIAKRVGCNPGMIRDLLNGRLKGNHGLSHKAALALRLKAPALGESPLDLLNAMDGDANLKPRGPDRRQKQQVQAGEELA